MQGASAREALEELQQRCDQLQHELEKAATAKADAERTLRAAAELRQIFGVVARNRDGAICMAELLAAGVLGQAVNPGFTRQVCSYGLYSYGHAVSPGFTRQVYSYGLYSYGHAVSPGFTLQKLLALIDRHGIDRDGMVSVDQFVAAAQVCTHTLDALKRAATHTRPAPTCMHARAHARSSTCALCSLVPTHTSTHVRIRARTRACTHATFVGRTRVI